jgi:type IV pilus assembly protein PilB
LKRATTESLRVKRKFQRGNVRVAVVLRSDDGKVATGEARDVSAGGMKLTTHDKLGAGIKGFAQLALPGGQVVRAAVETVWEDAIQGSGYVYGIRFNNLGATERFALLEAIYAPGAGERPKLTSLTGDDGPVGTQPLSPAHHAYYLRLLRRIEQSHKLNPADTDRILYARLYLARSLREILVDYQIVPQAQLDEFLSAIYGVPYIDLSRTRPDPNATEAIPVGIATSQYIIPISSKGDTLVVAMADPADLPTLDLIQLRAKKDIDVRFALVEEIEASINNVYHGATLHSADKLIDTVAAVKTVTDGFVDGADVEDLETLRRLSDATPIITLVDSVLRSAVDDGSSDIHLEPFGDGIVVRFRLDGVLHEMRQLPKNAYAAVVSRIKIMGRMDITIRHIPQDGRASIRFQRKEFDLRISSLPTVFGEKIVIRLLEKSPHIKDLKAVGFSDANYALFAPLIRRPYGMILVCGPTGSGKSTTLFACLQEINDGATNITTIEDPVEYRIPGVNQVEVNVKRGLTFAGVLRSLLRQDPDIIYVGEIRDRDTADLSVRAALTGHLLLSTLHTNSAVQAIARLVDIGVDPAMIGSSLIGVVGQRLVRRICLECKEQYELPPEETLILSEMLPLVTPASLWRGRGCDLCHDTGYRGRMAVHEILPVDEGLRRLIAKGADSNQLLDHCSAQGFTDLRDDAMQRLLEGETTLREVMRVTV